MKMKWRKLLISAASAVIMVIAVSAVTLSRPASETHPLGASLAHAQGDGSMGCSNCHTAPIVSVNCSDCHSTPPTKITAAQINFPHHDAADAPEGITCQVCHMTSGNDARFVTTPAAGHDYCTSCHNARHSGD